MSRKIIADTSVWIEYFKDNAGIADFMDKNLLEGSIYTVGIIVAELIQGVKHAEDRKIVRSSIDALEYIETTYDDWVRIGELSSSLRKSGITLLLTDIVIAAIAIRHDLELATLDKHFKLVPELKLAKDICA